MRGSAEVAERLKGRQAPPPDQKGFALLLAVIVVVFLTLIGLTLTRSSLTEYTMSNEFEAHAKAVIIADSAFNVAKEGLRGKDLSTLLSGTQAVPKYVNYVEPQPGSYAARNPLPPLEAKNIDFTDPPSPIGIRNVPGFLTPSVGVPMGRGRFFARLTDNQDEAPLGLAEDPNVDNDYTVYLRVVGVHPGAHSETNVTGTSIKNAIAILEGLLRRDLSFDLASPLTVYGPDVQADFSGNSFDLIGDDEHSAVTVLYDDEGGGDADRSYNSMLAAIGSKGTVTGLEGPDGLSLQDGTQDVRTSGNPDSTNVFDAVFLANLGALLAAYADNLYTEPTSLSGGGILLGTPDAPEITVAQSDHSLQGNGSGAGILLVQGNFDLSGSFDFDGIVLVVGAGNLSLSGANKNLTGGVYVANFTEDRAHGRWEFGVPNISIAGNSNFIFNSDNLRMAVNQLPVKVLSLREITPEIEPGT